MISDREALIEDGRLLKGALTDCSGIDEKLDGITQEMEVVAGLIDKCVRDNAFTEQDQEEYNKRYTGLTDRYETLQAKQATLEKERREREMKADILRGFLFELGELDERDMEFKPQRWNAIIDHVTVYHDGRLVFSFHNGSEIAVTI